MIYIFSWIALSVAIGYVGKNRDIGFWGAFFLSLLLSPLIGLIIALVSKQKLIECTWCGYAQKEYFHFCPICGKDDNGLKKEHYQATANQAIS